MSVSSPFIHRPIATSLLGIAVMLGGILGYLLAAGLLAAAGRFPDHPGDHPASGRQPRHHGVAGDGAARAQFGQIPVAAGHDLVELVRDQPDHAAVRAQPRHRRRRAGRAGGDQCRRLDAAAQPALPAGLLQGEPGRRADRDAGAHLAHHLAAPAQRPHRQHAGAAAERSDRRRPRHHPGRHPAGGPHPGRSVAARPTTASASKTCARRSWAPIRPARRARSTAPTSPTPSRATTRS